MIADARYLPLQDKSVNCIITSPPYWSLRKYDIPDLIWDGENVTPSILRGEECKHEWGNRIKGKNYKPGKTATVGSTLSCEKWNPNNQGQFCLHCSAWRGQLGLEPTIDLYLKHLMQIMDECKRVLRDDGTMFVNLGDSYSGSGCGTNDYRTEASKSIQGIGKNINLYKTGGIAQKIKDIPSKSLCLIPYRFAIEMVNRGWILRNIIIWHKPNCMPASVKDRFTVDFEPVFFFVKNRKYWFEQQYESQTEYTTGGFLNKATSKYGKAGLTSLVDAKINPRGRNRRCVWIIPTQPYPEFHFATFPEALVEFMIRAGCPKGGIVLDPLCGSGTTIRVAEKLNRVGIGYDLAYDNLEDKRMRLIQKEMF